MANLALGFGASHGPLLSTPPHEWDLRANVDRKNAALAYRDGTYDFATLAALRKDEGFAALNAPAVRAERHARCQQQLDAMSEQVLATNPDVVVVVGDDQDEWFQSDIQPAFAIFHGKEVNNRALTAAEIEHRTRIGSAYAMKVYHPPADEIYPCASGLAEQMIAQAMADDFDITTCATQPKTTEGHVRRLGHAFGFIYRRVLRSKPIPIVPVMVNTYFTPNQPTSRRCFQFGRSLGRAIRAWKSDANVAVAASGGVSHFVIDEPFDHRILQAMQNRDERALTSEPEYMYRSGNSEIKNWITVAGMLADTDLRMNLLDYVPCYRSEAGTGNAMAFAIWR